MTKRQSDSEESCAPDGRRWWNKPGYVVVTLVGVVGVLILLGVNSVLGDIKNKVDISRYDSDQRFIKEDISEMKGDVKELLKRIPKR